MIELKKSELEQTLLTLSTYDNTTKELISGLLKENITLGTKRGLQKIHKEAVKAYNELIEDIKTTQTECGEDTDRLQKELLYLFDESIKLDASPIQFSFIENISTTTNYNFDIINKIAI